MTKTEKQIRLRNAVADDARHVAELIKLLGDNSTITSDYAGEYLAHPSTTVLLAEDGETVVGLLSYSVRPCLFHGADTCMVEDFVVREESRRQGVGNRLFEELMRRVEAGGCAELSVSTAIENEEAIRFYRAHGLTDEAMLLERHW